jgi:hypothetical protein
MLHDYPTALDLKRVFLFSPKYQREASAPFLDAAVARAALRHGMSSLSSGQYNPTTLPIRISGTAPAFDVMTIKNMIGCFLISERVVRLLSKASVTGWHPREAEVVRENGVALPGYCLLVVTGRVGAIKTVVNRAVPGKRLPLPIPIFDSSTWDGSSIFRPQGSGVVLVLDSVKALADDASISNAEFVPIVS